MRQQQRWIGLIGVVALVMMLGGIEEVGGQGKQDAKRLFYQRGVKRQANASTTATLSNGTGDGSLTVTVDGYGSFGHATTAGGEGAVYDPVGPIGPSRTVFESGLYFGPLGNFLTTDSFGAALPPIEFTAKTMTSAQSEFDVAGFHVVLLQQVSPIGPGGSTLTQEYRITNATGAPANFRVVRHMDGDLFFVGGLGDDFGGLSADGQTAFEFDASEDPEAAITYVGLAGMGGVSIGATVQPYPFIDNIVDAGRIPPDLLNRIAGDEDRNGVTDDGYDVTLSLEHLLAAAPGETVVYVTRTIFGQGSPEFGARSVTPNVGGNAGHVTALISGAGFQAGATARLVRGGQPDIVGNQVEVGTGGRTLKATFDLTGKEPGVWDVVVTNPDGTTVSLPGGFTIETGGASQVWVDIIGREAIRAGREQRFTVLYGNHGSVDTFDVLLLIKLSAGTSFKVNIPPPNLPGVNWGQVPQGAVVGSQTVIPIWIYSVPAGSTQSFSLMIQAPFGQDGVKMRTEVIQSEPTPFTQTGDFTFVGDSSIFFAITRAYSIFHAGGLSSMPVTDFADRLRLWLQANRNEIRVVPYYFLPVAAVTGILGTPINDDRAIAILSDPFASTIRRGFAPTSRRMSSPLDFFFGPWYGNYCGPGWNDINGNGIPDEPPLDELDAACKEHDAAYGALGLGGVWDTLVGIWQPVPGQDEADDILCRAALAFDPNQSYAGPAIGLLAKAAIITIFCDPSPLDIFCLGVQVVDEIISVIVTAIDPNEIVGSLGAGERRYLSGAEPLRYAIYFENIETATAPAQEVVITDQLDTTTIDLSTFSLGPIAFGDIEVTPPPGLREFTTDVDLRPAKNLIVRITAQLNPETGLLTYRFTSLDPATMQLPEDPLLGFLPPNKNPPEGDGSVVFTVMPKHGLPTETVIRNKARIFFDLNAPIDTPEWFNTIDNDKPTSQIAALPAMSPTTFTLQWSGNDIGSGIQDFTVFVSDDGGPYTALLRNTTQTSTAFQGQFGHTYGFLVTARDNAFNVENAPNVPDAVTSTVTALDVTTQLRINRGNVNQPVTTRGYVQRTFRGRGGGGTVTGRATQIMTIKNKGGTPIQGPLSLVLDQLSPNATLFNASGRTMNIAPLGSPFINVNVGGDNVLSPGETVRVMLEFTNPSGNRITYRARVLAGEGAR